MGTVELRDQVEALLYLATNGACTYTKDCDLGPAWEALKTEARERRYGGYIDPEKVAITGWSYGGYLSLMALAQYPSIFKMSLAGAPVTCWELYDTGYTERYMGLPDENPEGYRRGRVLEHIDRFPDSENRLLVVHGLIDENVHFKNTELLVSALVRHSKPHQVQIYPSERHGLRAANVIEHFETLMFWWLGSFL
ncbi:hypothetical protein HK104_001864 [Borealophlyctis nickersoniae]|nr:hypothetical protein HK104_001864 [Borealophlyctis nickersoniae]